MCLIISAKWFKTCNFKKEKAEDKEWSKLVFILLLFQPRSLQTQFTMEL